MKEEQTDSAFANVIGVTSKLRLSFQRLQVEQREVALLSAVYLIHAGIVLDLKRAV